MKKVALISLGCVKNLVDSEVMLGYLDKAGYTIVTDPDDSDIIIINTCSFIQPARKEAIDALKKAVEIQRNKEKKKIVAAGCYVERNKEDLKKIFPQIDVWIGVNDFDKIVQAVEGKPFKSSTNCFLYDHNSPRLISTPPAWAYVKISEGCSHQCSFCAIPLIKGAYRSRSISSIVQEVKELASKGVKEINLVSQDSTYFYRDISLDNGLPILLKELLGIKKLEWIRILYGHPEEISDALLDIMKEEKICSYLDIPFQHSDPFIIKKMKRALDGKRALKLLQKIRKKLPGIAIRTSLVVGFPGEGKKEFDDLSNFVKEAKFDHMGVFTYSREEGTDCFTSGDPVKESEKRRRKDEIMEIQAEISYQANKKYLNQKIDVLIEGTLEADDRGLLARGMFQAPEVDGVVFINLEGKVPDVIKTVHRVEIIDTDIYDLYGNLIK